MKPSGIARENTGCSSGKDATDRIKRLASHNQYASHRKTLEASQVGTQLLGHIAIKSNHSRWGRGDDGG
ncbi:MAG: hypothetical protein R3C05_24230 [Pirellulaceae bacterium]